MVDKIIKILESGRDLAGFTKYERGRRELLKAMHEGGFKIGDIPEGCCVDKIPANTVVSKDGQEIARITEEMPCLSPMHPFGMVVQEVPLITFHNQTLKNNEYARGLYGYLEMRELAGVGLCIDEIKEGDSF